MGGSSRFGPAAPASLMEQSDNYSDGYDHYSYRGKAAARKRGRASTSGRPACRRCWWRRSSRRWSWSRRWPSPRTTRRTKGTTLKFRAREEDGAAPVVVALHPPAWRPAKGIHGDRANNGKGLGNNFLVCTSASDHACTSATTPRTPSPCLGGRALSVSATGSSNGGNGGNNRRQQQSREVEVMVDDWMPFKLLGAAR